MTATDQDTPVRTTEEAPFERMADSLDKAMAILDLVYSRCESEVELSKDTLTVAAFSAMEHVAKVRAYLRRDVESFESCSPSIERGGFDDR